MSSDSAPNGLFCPVGQTLRKDNSCDSTVAIYMNYLSMAETYCIVSQHYSTVGR